jgi:hypothetical protein
MTSRIRMSLVFALTTAVVLVQTNSASPREISVGAKKKGESSNDENGGRRRRNRDKSGVQFGGSEAQNVQQAIQNLQSNVNPQQSDEPAAPTGQFQGGKQMKKSQQWQNWQQQGGGQGNWKKKRRHHDWDSWSIQFGGHAPFSVQWYNDHPRAWQHRRHHDDDAWKFATAAGVLGWLGWHANHPYDATMMYEPLPLEAIYVEGHSFDPHAGQWMTLGVYSLMTNLGDNGTRVLELAIDKHGHVRGNYYDMITGANHTVTGRVHEPTQYVQWSLDKNRQLTFFAHLSQLTQPDGIVYVRFPGGQQEEWQLVRMESATH